MKYILILLFLSCGGKSKQNKLVSTKAEATYNGSEVTYEVNNQRNGNYQVEVHYKRGNQSPESCQSQQMTKDDVNKQSTKIQLVNLAPKTKYSYRVCLFFNDEIDDQKFGSFETKGLPLVSSLEGKTNGYRDRLIVEWDGIGENLFYKLSYKKGHNAPENCDEGSAASISINENRFSRIIMGLNAQSYYSIRVCTFDLKGNRNDGIAITLKTLDRPEQPIDPVNLRISEKTTTSVRLSWDEAPYEGYNYVFRYKEGDKAPSSCLTESLSQSDGTSVVLDGLKADTQYSVLVCSQDVSTLKLGPGTKMTFKTDDGCIFRTEIRYRNGVDWGHLWELRLIEFPPRCQQHNGTMMYQAIRYGSASSDVNSYVSGTFGTFFNNMISNYYCSGVQVEPRCTTLVEDNTLEKIQF